jgi:hypothetical protein
MTDEGTEFYPPMLGSGIFPSEQTGAEITGNPAVALSNQEGLRDTASIDQPDCGPTACDVGEGPTRRRSQKIRGRNCLSVQRYVSELADCAAAFGDQSSMTAA